MSELLDERTIPSFHDIDGQFQEDSEEEDDFIVSPTTKTSKKLSSRTRTKEKPGRREKIPEGTLCVVCADLASGIHYGVASCNGCKTFFRRALVNKQAFQCQFANDCLVDKSVRCGCRACRLKKCYDNGMNPNAIQNDRDKIRYSKRHRSSVDQDEKPSALMLLEIKTEPSSHNAKSLENGLHEKMLMYLGDETTYENLKIEVETTVRDLVNLEGRVNLVRHRASFAHCSAASCMCTPCLLLDEKWLASNMTGTLNSYDGHSTPILCDRVHLRAWFVKDIRLMIEWVKCLSPTIDKLLLNDKMALVKAFAPVWPLLQLAFYTEEQHSMTIDRSPMGNLGLDRSPMGNLGLDRSPMGNIGLDRSPMTKIGLDRSPMGNLGLSPISEPSPSSSLSQPSPGMGMGNHRGQRAQTFSSLTRLRYPDGTFLEESEKHADDLPHEEATGARVVSMLLDMATEMRNLNVTISQFVLFKSLLFFNPDATGLTETGKTVIEEHRKHILGLLHAFISADRPPRAAIELFSHLLLLNATLNRVATFQLRAFELARIFGQSNDIIDELLLNNGLDK